jgi:hypothetical protein
MIYFLLEVAPEIYHGRSAQNLKHRVKTAIDPDKEIRDAEYKFNLTPTVTNRLQLSYLLMRRGDYDRTIALLEPALTGHFTDDVLLLEGLSYAYYDKGDYKNALRYIQKIFDRPDSTPADYIRLLRVRALVADGEKQIALAELMQLVEHFTGEEARIALAQLHESMGAPAAALVIYRDISTRARHAPEYYRKQEAVHIKMAEDGLKRLTA